MTIGFDAVLACAIPLVAWRALAADDLEKSVVLLISLGMLAALAWARLDAPDVALVEAAVGAGLTGALMMSTVRAMGPMPRAPGRDRKHVILAVLIAALAVVVLGVVLGLPEHAQSLGASVLAHMPESGVGHPVTAVLLNFRGYDTLLEVAVLVEAIVVVAIRARPGRGEPRTRADTDSPIAVLVRLLVPGIILVAGYILWRGSNGPGGAFQAGAILAGGGILMIAGGVITVPDTSSRLVRAVLVIGPGAFVVVAAAPLGAGHQLLEYPPGAAGWLIAAIEAALTASIALVLLMFFPTTDAGART
jgi:multisubunit Na+/H+ antiporter MnhB subunit